MFCPKYVLYYEPLPGGQRPERKEERDMNEHTDILVVGAGFAGAVCARALAEQGRLSPADLPCEIECKVSIRRTGKEVLRSGNRQ